MTAPKDPERPEDIQPVLDLIGNEEPSDLVLNFATTLGVEPERLALVLTWFMSSANASAYHRAVLLAVQHGSSGVLSARDYAEELMRWMKAAQRDAEQTTGLLAYDTALDAVLSALRQSSG